MTTTAEALQSSALEFFANFGSMPNSRIHENRYFAAPEAKFNPKWGTEFQLAVVRIAAQVQTDKQALSRDSFLTDFAPR